MRPPAVLKATLGVGLETNVRRPKPCILLPALSVRNSVQPSELFRRVPSAKPFALAILRSRVARSVCPKPIPQLARSRVLGMAVSIVIGTFTGCFARLLKGRTTIRESSDWSTIFLHSHWQPNSRLPVAHTSGPSACGTIRQHALRRRCGWL